MSELIDRSPRVSTLELFFDLVFVFTVTQLTGVLVAGGGAASALHVVVMLAVIWWMYDGYAWLTNAIATDLLRFRLLLLGGMGGFLVIALSVPTAYGVNGLAFGIGYVVVVLLHAGMFAKSTSISEVTAILRIVPFNLTAAVMVLVGGIAGGRAQDVLWLLAALLLWVTPWFTSTEGFVIEARHFVERHGLVIIVALGESIVVIGAGATGRPLDVGIVLVALLALALSACLWWLYFRDEEAVEKAMTDATPTRRARFALVAFGYWHYGLVLGVVARCSGTEEVDQGSIRSARLVDRPGARRRCRALHRLHGGVRCCARARLEACSTDRGRTRARDDSPRHGVDRRVAARCADADHQSSRSSSRRGGTRHRRLRANSRS